MSEWRYFAAWRAFGGPETIQISAADDAEEIARLSRYFARSGIRTAGPFDDRAEAVGRRESDVRRRASGAQAKAKKGSRRHLAAGSPAMMRKP
jgi:hypothetical protein